MQQYIGLHIWNYLPDTLGAKWSFQTFKRPLSDYLDLSTIAKLAVKWIILKCYYLVNVILDSILIILVFIVNFLHLKLFFFTLHIFNFFI